VGLQTADRVPVDDRDLLPADSTAADTGQVIEISPVLRRQNLIDSANLIVKDLSGPNVTRSSSA
jgi:hypothetical protein